ncbi:hypothetical protein HZB69_01315 [Candidatus Amesbacteria bacterium]|nr:hypothetical protein [Candidatus Amesbacteria bacterium]
MRRRSRRFRFQLLHEWLVSHYPPQKAVDVGGGKGLLAYLLIQSGWDVTVIDPVSQILPRTFKNLQKVRTTLDIDKRGQISRIDKSFEIDMASDYEFLIGLHSPCCVIDEPIIIKPGVNWLESLIHYAETKGFTVGQDKLGFKSQDTLIYSN